MHFILSNWPLGFLQALEVEGLAKVMSKPRLVTLSGRPASLLDGGEQAILVPAGLGQVGVQFEEFGTRLNVLPIVLGNGRIHLEFEPEISTLVPNTGVTLVTGGLPVNDRATQRVNTTVELEDGQTFVLGGLTEHRVVANTNQTPVIGQLPFIGFFFSTKTYTETEQELIVMVTPHLVDAQDCGQLARCLPGQETRSPDDFELFLEGILESPRGPREVCPGGHYVAAYKNGPTVDLFPCGGRAGCGCAHGGHGAGCGNGSCGDSHAAAPAARPVEVPVAQASRALPEPTNLVVPPAQLPISVPDPPRPTSSTLPPPPATGGAGAEN
jgi:pilus assembly protein CpaC